MGAGEQARDRLVGQGATGSEARTGKASTSACRPSTSLSVSALVDWHINTKSKKAKSQLLDLRMLEDRLKG